MPRSGPVVHSAPAPPLAWVASLRPQHLRALSWHYALLAQGVPSLSPRRVDPRSMSKENLRAHIYTNLLDVAEPTRAELRDMVAVLKSQSNEEVLAVTSSPAEERRGRRGRRSAGVAHLPPSSSPVPPEPAPASRRRRPSVSPGALEDASDSGESETSSVADEHSDDAITPTRPHGTVTRVKRQRLFHIHMSCPSSCGCIARQDQIPAFCPGCGKTWARPAAGSAATAAPQRWRGLDTFVYTPPSALPVAPYRNVQLASLSNTIVDAARKGQQHYTIADLLCPLAHDGTSASALVDEHSFVLLSDGTGGVTARTGAAASEARSLGARKRAITGMSDIFEVFWFVLIPIIYEGRPDIGQQLCRLLGIAFDVARATSWKLALHYVNSIRFQYWMDPGVHKRHVLEIDTTRDLGMWEASIFLSSQTLLHTSSSAASPGGTPSTRGAPGGKPHVCNDWNRDACTRTQCKYPHKCAICGGGHPQIRCNRSSTQSSSTQRPAAPKATPSSVAAAPVPGT